VARRKRHPAGSGDTGVQEVIAQQPAANDAEALWEAEYERSRFDWAAEQVRRQVEPATWQAFWQTAVEGKAADQVARTLGMTAGAVYIAKSRVIARLRKQLEGQEDS
jgi:RNA polymerase sigma-70 factor (ECF subfamily)